MCYGCGKQHDSRVTLVLSRQWRKLKRMVDTGTSQGFIYGPSISSFECERLKDAPGKTWGEGRGEVVVPEVRERTADKAGQIHYVRANLSTTGGMYVYECRGCCRGYVLHEEVSLAGRGWAADSIRNPTKARLRKKSGDSGV